MIRYGILGFGLYAARRIMPAFAMAKTSRVTALSRRSLEKAQASANEFNIPLAFDSAEQLCRSQEVDAVFVTTPNSLHLQDVLLAIRCGKPVLCEKPMGMYAGECERMVEAAYRAGVLLGVAQVFRFENSTARLRERIHSGQIGKPVFARAEFSYLGRGHARTWITDLAISGGGPIADVGVHCIDALRFMLQDEVVQVSAQGMSDPQSGEVEAAAALALSFGKGTLGSVLVSTRAEYRTPIEIVGEEGVLRADDGLTVDHPITIELNKDGKVADTEIVSNRDAYARQLDAFGDAVEGKATFPVPGEEGWQNQEILDAAYRSLKSGKSEPVLRIPRDNKNRTARLLPRG